MAKKKTPEGEKCERALPFKLNDEDKARKGEVAAQLNKQLEAAQDAKKKDAAKHNEKIGDLTKKVSAQLKMISEGVERRPVECTMVKNFESNKIEFWYEQEILEERDMTPADRQLDLTEKEKKAAKKTEKWQKMAPKHKAKGYKEDDETDPEVVKSAEIASIHRLETSKKGASSSVDPK